MPTTHMRISLNPGETYRGRREQNVQLHPRVLGVLLGDEAQQLAGRLVFGGQQAGAALDVFKELDCQRLELQVLVKVLERSRSGRSR